MKRRFEVGLSCDLMEPQKLDSFSQIRGMGSATTPIASVGKRAAVSSVKKLVVKNLSAAPTLRGDFAENTWDQLQEAVSAIYEQRLVATTFEELYQLVETACQHNLAALLYQKLQDLLELFINKMSQALVDSTLEEESFLQRLSATWLSHCEQLAMIRSVFIFLDRTYVLQSPSKLSVWDLGQQFFCDCLVTQSNIRPRITRALLNEVRREQAYEVVDQRLLRCIIRMLVNLQVYAPVFEEGLLQQTEALYRRESAEQVSQLAMPAYLQYAAGRLEEERARLVAYLDPSTRRRLIANSQKQLIETHVTFLLAPVAGADLSYLLAGSHTPDLLLLYSLLSTVDQQAPLRAAFLSWLRVAGSEIVQNRTADAAKDKEMVTSLIALRERMDDVIANAFMGDIMFTRSLTEAFQFFINDRPNKPAELIAKYMDGILRSGNKNMTEDELEYSMDRALAIFRYIHGKDVFEAFYKKDLAKRLLLAKSASDDAEKAMLSKLKQECGSSFTCKLEGMFRDIEVSKDIMTSFKQTWVSNIDLSVNVIQMGNWPTYEPLDVVLPVEVKLLQDQFQTYYLSKHNGRRLQWQNSLGHCTLKAHCFPGGKKELDVSIYQALALLIFNGTQQKFTFTQLETELNMAAGELVRTLQSLACAKVRVLKKEPMSKDVSATDTFEINPDFRHKLFKIRINQIQLRETVEEQEATQEQVFVDRQYQIDAAIVRVMKTRKSCTYAQMCSDLYAQLKFPLRGSDIKKRIESLIEREYLRRDDETPSLFKYVA